MKHPSLSKYGRKMMPVAMMMAVIGPLTTEANRRPTRAELAVEAAQQAELDALDAKHAQKARELAEKEEAEDSKLSLEAEAAVTDEIGKAYHEAILQYEQRAFSAAQNRFLDCYSLCQLAGAKFSDPTGLKTIQKGCEERLARIRQIEQQASRTGGLKRKLEGMMVPRFYVNEAELNSVLDLIRKRIGELGKCSPPNFTLMVSPELLTRKVTLDVNGLPMSAVLETVLRMAGAEVRFERYSAVITELPTAQRPN